VPRHKVLREFFGAFQKRSPGLGSKTGNAPFLQSIGQPQGQRGLWTYDHQIHGLALREGSKFIHIRRLQRDELRQFPYSRIAGGGVKPFQLRILGQFPRQSVLSSAASDKQNLHLNHL
jgi:hypothetical protein